MNAFSRRMMSDRADCSDKLKESGYSCNSNELKKSMTSTGNCRNNELKTSLTSTRTVR